MHQFVVVGHLGTKAVVGHDPRARSRHFQLVPHEVGVDRQESRMQLDVIVHLRAEGADVLGERVVQVEGVESGPVAGQDVRLGEGHPRYRKQLDRGPRHGDQVRTLFDAEVARGPGQRRDRAELPGSGSHVQDLVVFGAHEKVSRSLGHAHRRPVHGRWATSPGGKDFVELGVIDELAVAQALSKRGGHQGPRFMSPDRSQPALRESRFTHSSRQSV
jgi:hypothetical protein